VLISHLYFKPFVSRWAHRVESAFLFNLSLIAALEIPSATYKAFGSDYSSTTTGYVLQWIVIVLIILPLVFCLLAVVALNLPRDGFGSRMVQRFINNGESEEQEPLLSREKET